MANDGWPSLASLANFAVGNLLHATGWLPTAVLGSLVMTHATYQQIYLASAAASFAIGTSLASTRRRADCLPDQHTRRSGRC